MKAWLLESLTGLDALRLEANAPDPASPPPPGHVLIRLRRAALNPADYYLARKEYPARPKLPHVLGRDGSGSVEAVGEGVSHLRAGDRVVLLRGAAGVSAWGTLAERVSVPATDVAILPQGWSLEEGAAAPLVYCTAYQALTQWGPLQTTGSTQVGRVVLITGVSGGVGIAATHLAKAMGLRVIGTSRSLRKAPALREQGVDLVVSTEGGEQFAAEIKNFAGDEGVALIVDNVGGALLPQAMGTLGFRGAVSCVGALAGPVPEFNTARLFFKRLRVGGVAVGTYTREENRAAWDQVVDFLKGSRRRPLIDNVFSFSEVPQAFARLQEGPIGKVLVSVE